MFTQLHHRIAALCCCAFVALAACDARDAPLDVIHIGDHHGAVKPAPGMNVQLAQLRQVTARFHNFEHAMDAGYVAQVTPCWRHQSEGAMGYHYGRPDLIEDGTVNLLEPELLMYEPQPGGHMRLVGMEYIVPIDDWQGAAPPVLLGQTFTQHSILPIYKLHIWLWRDNPDGMFADWNPKVTCRSADETETFD